MKMSSVFDEIYILSIFVFQVTILDLKFFIKNKQKLLGPEPSQIQIFSNHSVLNKSDEIAEKVKLANMFGVHHISNRNYANKAGIKEWVPYS